MTKIIIFGVILSLFGIGFANAQSEEDNSQLASVRKITELTMEHVFLRSLAGEWKLIGLNKSTDEEVPLSGNATISTIMNGHYIELNLNVNQAGGSMNSKLIIGYDTRTNSYSLYSLDDITNYSNFSKGTRTGDKLIFKGTDYMIKFEKDIPFRIEINKERENKLTILIYYLVDGKDKLMIDYQLIKQNVD